ncbi:MAG: radical SAM protein [Bacteroidetes bacterium]|nr:radical SAM protein [Bacteroidota bacterium]
MNCSIWKNKKEPSPNQALSIEQLDKFFSSPAAQKVDLIGIAGGEPTISHFFSQLLKAVPVSKQITITTNGLAHKKLIDYLVEQPEKNRFLIQVSIDGLEEINDSVWGMPGGFQKAVSLLAKLKEIGIKSLLSFTINRKNYHQLIDVYRLALAHGAGFSTRMAYCGGAYENVENMALFYFEDDELQVLEKSIAQIINDELDRPDHNPVQLVFWDWIVRCYRDRKNQRQVPCKAMETGVVIDLNGEVFPNCPVLMKKKLGNIKERDLDDILSGIEAAGLKHDIDKFKCGGCWNDCQVVTNIGQSRAFLFDAYNKIKMRKFQSRTELPEAIDFSVKDTPFVLSGWHFLEKHNDFGFRWAEPEFALLVPGHTREIELFVSIPEHILRFKPATVTFRLEGVKPIVVSVATPEWQWVKIKFPNMSEAIRICTVSVNDYYSPGEQGNSEDFRKLGLAVNSIRFISVKRAGQDAR